VTADQHFELAFRYLQGRGVSRSLSQARENFERASALGHAKARMIYLAFVGNGTGGPQDWALATRLLADAAAEHVDHSAADHELIQAMDLTENGDPRQIPRRERLGERPEVDLFRSFLSPAECAYLIETAMPVFVPATVGHVSRMVGGVIPQIRTCETAGLPWVRESPAVHAINRRIAAASGTQADWGEPLQVLRYRPGQEFKPHRDCTADVANQRILTMLIYLNEDYSGGETLFLKTGLKVRGRTGDALLFRNADDNGAPDMDTLHAGLPVQSGEKYLASRWIRRRRFGPANE
jgi:prolyl 4-hydroxylase